MQNFSTSPIELVASFWRNRGLILSLIKREIIGRYKGSIFGLLWSFFNPIFMLAVYTFIFSVVFRARWSEGAESKSVFALVLFAGLIVFNLFSECINRAPGTILSNANFVKKVVFPLEVLPWINIGAALFHSLISIAVWIVFYLIELGIPHVTILLFPLVLLPLVFFIMGLSWTLASLGVYLRDVGQLIGIVTTIIMFLSPIFFPISALPASYQKYLLFNPLAPVIEQMRDVLFWGRIPSILFYLAYLVGSVVVACVGFAWFQKTRKGFADVI